MDRYPFEYPFPFLCSSFRTNVWTTFRTRRTNGLKECENRRARRFLPVASRISFSVRRCLSGQEDAASRLQASERSRTEGKSSKKAKTIRGRFSLQSCTQITGRRMNNFAAEWRCSKVDSVWGVRRFVQKSKSKNWKVYRIIRNTYLRPLQVRNAAIAPG